MSLIGGFNFGPNDRTEQSDGVPHSPHTKDILRHERHLSQQDETLGDPETTHKSKQHVASLARQFSRDSLAGKEDIFNYVKGSHLDPFSETFDAQQWTKQLTEVSRNEGRLSRTSGVAFRNLGVYGYGSEAGECGDRDIHRPLITLANASQTTSRRSATSSTTCCSRLVTTSATVAARSRS